MLKPLNFVEFNKVDLIPQAIIRKPVSHFKREGISFVRDHDALDAFEGAAFLLDGMPFALMHHRGYPNDTTTVCFPRAFGEDIEKITASIRTILSALNLSSDSLVWERKDNPDL